MESVEERRRKALAQFLGYVSFDTAQIVFVGYEFGGSTWDSGRVGLARSVEEKKLIADNGLSVYEEAIAEMHSFLPRKFWHREWRVCEDCFEIFWTTRRPSPTEKMQVYLAMESRRILLSEDRQPFSWGDTDGIKRFYQGDFCREIEVQTNIYPVAKPSESEQHDKITLDYLGFHDSKECYKYFSGDSRFSVLRRELSALRHKPDTFFFFTGIKDDEVGLCERLFGEKIEFHQSGDLDQRHLKLSGCGRIAFTPILPHVTGLLIFAGTTLTACSNR